ncbi:MAG: nucleoside hydrolase [Planctomycetes bacterium]|nr:nucleoside hydrolase [Planctomycetota bacterium]
MAGTQSYFGKIRSLLITLSCCTSITLVGCGGSGSTTAGGATASTADCSSISSDALVSVDNDDSNSLLAAAVTSDCDQVAVYEDDGRVSQAAVSLKDGSEVIAVFNDDGKVVAVRSGDDTLTLSYNDGLGFARGEYTTGTGESTASVFSVARDSDSTATRSSSQNGGANAAFGHELKQFADTLAAERCRIAAIGPLTNVATLIQHRPELAEQVEEVVIVAGRSRDRSLYLGDVGPVRDFNFECDVRAAQILLSSGIAVVLAGFELSSQVVITQADLERIRVRGGATADYLHRNSLAWCSYWTQQFPHDRGFHPWDSAAIAWLLRPELFETESRGWRIRDVALTREERERNPDGSPESVAWLECDPGFPGIAHTYCTGFKAGRATEFVRHVMDGVY